MDLETRLKYIDRSVFNHLRIIPVWYPGPNIIKHDADFRFEIPVDAEGEIAFPSSTDILIIQIKIRMANGHFQCTPLFVSEIEFMPGLNPGKNTVRSVIYTMLAGYEIADRQIMPPKGTIPFCIRIHKAGGYFSLKWNCAVNKGQLKVDPVLLFGGKLIRIHQELVGDVELRDGIQFAFFTGVTGSIAVP